jgi:hypothetical protein
MKMFTEENTNGYTAAQLAALNAALTRRLIGVEPGSDEAIQIEKEFADQIGHAAEESIEAYNTAALAGFTQEQCDAEQLAALGEILAR